MLIEFIKNKITPLTVLTIAIKNSKDINEIKRKFSEKTKEFINNLIDKVVKTEDINNIGIQISLRGIQYTFKPYNSITLDFKFRKRLDIKVDNLVVKLNRFQFYQATEFSPDRTLSFINFPTYVLLKKWLILSSIKGFNLTLPNIITSSISESAEVFHEGVKTKSIESTSIINNVSSIEILFKIIEKVIENINNIDFNKSYVIVPYFILRKRKRIREYVGKYVSEIEVREFVNNVLSFVNTFLTIWNNISNEDVSNTVNEIKSLCNEAIINVEEVGKEYLIILDINDLIQVLNRFIDFDKYFRLDSVYLQMFKDIQKIVKEFYLEVFDYYIIRNKIEYRFRVCEDVNEDLTHVRIYVKSSSDLGKVLNFENEVDKLIYDFIKYLLVVKTVNIFT